MKAFQIMFVVTCNEKKIHMMTFLQGDCLKQYNSYIFLSKFHREGPLCNDSVLKRKFSLP
jgi:hypothetical protein